MPSSNQVALDALAQEITENNVCPELVKSATQLVMGDGNAQADIVLVGEAPGAKEDVIGKPFIGAAGKLLNLLLESIKLERDDVYITNIVKYRPPANRDPKPAEIAAFLPYLQRQLQIIKPVLVILLGRHAMNVFLPELKIGQAHGHVVRQDAVTYLPLYHPAAALYNGGLRSQLFEDFAAIPGLLKTLSSPIKTT